MVSIAFYGGIPGGISTPIVQQSEQSEKSYDEGTIFKPYHVTTYDSKREKMAEGRDPRYQEDKMLTEDKEDNKRRNDWWKIGMFLLCLMGATGGMLWWYEGQPHEAFIGLVAVGGKLEDSGMTNAIECWGTFPGCRPFEQYFQYDTNRTIHGTNESATLLEAYHREITHIYRTSCVDSDHCQEYTCNEVILNKNNTTVHTSKGNNNTRTIYWGFKWLECNQTEDAKTILVPEEEMMALDNDTWIPKGCNETWARLKHCPVDLLYGIHPVRLCVQPPFFLAKNNTWKNYTLSNCGPSIFLGILEENKAVVKSGNCTVEKTLIMRSDYSGQYITPIFYKCNISVTSCNNGSSISVIMYESNNVQYLLCNYNKTNNYNYTCVGQSSNYTCVVQSFGVIGQAHIELPRKNKKIGQQRFANYNCTVNNKTELERWKLVKTSGITPIPISSESNTGLVRRKRDFGISAIVAAIFAATAIAASATMSYIALTEANKVAAAQNYTFEVENGTLNGIELIEKQMHILYAMVLQTHADVQLLKEKQKVEETFNLIGCIERSHTFCHTGHPWNNSWGTLNDSTQWDEWVSQMESYNQQILVTLHAARNNLEQSMISFNTPDSIAQFGMNIWSHIANWIPGLGASIVKYIVLFLLVYVVLTSMPKILRNLLTTMSGAASSGSRYLKEKYAHRHASRDEPWDQDQYRVHLAGVTGGSDNKYYTQKDSKRPWNGELEEYNKQQQSWKGLIKQYGENYNPQDDNMEITAPMRITREKKKHVGGNPHQGSLNLEIQSDGGNIYDCCLKAQEGTLAIPCCGFLLWLFWGLLIILGRLLGYGLQGVAKIIWLCERGLNIILNVSKRLFNYIGRALNPPTSHIAMPQYV
uniref:Envelope glycoprotein n=1 Tax=Equine infectious anemia virus TaxID=11665 RepID=A0A5J6SCP4_9RETR|nr:envelope polyprotein [Equine infectious anemia virus]